MNKTIFKNDKNLISLQNLLNSGLYNGYLESDKFEFIRNQFPNNYRIIGNLNKDGDFDLKLELKFPINIAAKLLLVFGIVFFIVSLVNDNWWFLFIPIATGLIVLINFKLTEKKEIEYFREKLWELQKK
jgi:thiosulfate reductase cytochrome b subunit